MSSNTPRELTDRVVLITGASRGIGAAVARAAAAAGATTLLCARDVPALERLADTIEQAGDPAPLLVPINFEAASADDYYQVAEHIAATCNRLDGLVCNAAMLGELAPLASCDGVSWARVFQVNLHSVLLLLQAMLPLLGRATAASVVFTLAGEGLVGKAHWGAYGASKAALARMFEMLAAEHPGPAGPRFNAVVPPPTRTRLRATAYPAEDPRGLAAPDTVAPAYIELLGPRAAHCRGEIRVLDAGCRI